MKRNRREVPDEYRHFIGKTCVLACDIDGAHNESGLLTRMPAGSAVRVVSGEFVDDGWDADDDHFRFTVRWLKDERVSYDGAWPGLLLHVPMAEDDVRVCPECGRPIHADDEYRYGGREICEECMAAGADLGTRFRCPKCHARWDEEHLVNETGDYRVTGGDCPDCEAAVVPIPRAEREP